MRTNAALLDLSDRNLAEATREQSRWLPPTRIEEVDDVQFTSAGTRFPAGPWNAVIGVGSASNDPGRTLERARSFFGAFERGFTVYVRQHLDEALARYCEQAGYQKMADSPGMVLTERAKERRLGASVVIRDVEPGSSAADFVDVVGVAFESINMPEAMTRKLLALPERWLAPHWTVRIVYEGDSPVAGAMLLFSHGIAGLYWVGTLPSARGRGYADALVRELGNHALDRGARAVVLQASRFGEPVYRKIGYRELTRYPWYLAPRA